MVAEPGALDFDRASGEGMLWLLSQFAPESGAGVFSSYRVVTPDGVAYPLCCEPAVDTHPPVARSALVGVDHGADVEATPEAASLLKTVGFPVWR
ncbi:MAG: hypothetical protein U0U69_14940 [Acidimicrobiia bacterium]